MKTKSIACLLKPLPKVYLSSRGKSLKNLKTYGLNGRIFSKVLVKTNGLYLKPNHLTKEHEQLIESSV